MKLRSMSAEVRSVYGVKVEDCHGQLIELDGMACELTSYNSVVAYYHVKTGILYLLPRYDYSVTTWKHIHAFIQDYCDCTPDWGAKRIRQDMKMYNDNPDFAADFVPCVMACKCFNNWFRY